MICIVTLLRSKVYCSTTTEATSPGTPLRAARSREHCRPEQSSTAAGDLQGPTSAGEQLLPAKSDVTPEGRTTLQQGLATVDGGRRVDVPI